MANLASRIPLGYRCFVVRNIVVALLLGLSSLASADDFASFELAVGGHLPVGDSSWKRDTSASPTAYGAVAWHFDEHFGVAGSAAYIDQLDVQSPAGTYKPSIVHLRGLAQAFYEARPIDHLTVAVRLGLGLDEMLASWDMPEGGIPSYRDEQTSALAIEPGVGAWWDAGIGVQVGGEIALPISTSRTSMLLTPAFATYDFAVLAGIRITSKRD